MKICVVVLNWNSREHLGNCLKSLQLLKTDPHEVQIIVVDNASSDDSTAFIKKAYPQVTLLLNSQNLGSAEGNNVGLRYSLSQKANFSWMVKPNIQVGPESLLALLEAAQKYPQGGIFGSKIYFAPGKTVWYAGGQMDWANLKMLHRGTDTKDVGQFDFDTETDFVDLDSMFVRNEVLDQIGLLDPAYFLYYVENDFCQRAKKNNWKLMLASQSTVWRADVQDQSVGLSLQDYYTARNRLIFGFRYAPIQIKLLLLKEAAQLYFSGHPWQRRAVLDYFTGNLGAGSYQP